VTDEGGRTTSTSDDVDVARDVARTLHRLFRALVDVGFTDAQALQLVAATVTSVADAARLDER
jgi:hypothetical protein